MAMKKRLQVLLDEKLRCRAERAAKESGENLSVWVRQLIRRAVRDHEKQSKK